MKNYIKKYITDPIIEAIIKRTSDFEKKVEERIEKLIKEESYSWLPNGSCWLCTHPVSRKGGYITWLGRMFCGEQCLEKFHSLVSKPDESYKSFAGEKINTITPNEPPTTLPKT